MFFNEVLFAPKRSLVCIPNKASLESKQAFIAKQTKMSADCKPF